MQGEDVLAQGRPGRAWWEYLVVLVAVGIFVWLGMDAEAAPIQANTTWIAILSAATLVLLGLCGTLLWRRTKFS